MKKKQKWTVFSVLGLLILLLFAAICIAPFIYMTIMSFTQSTTLMLHWSDINFGDFTNFNYVLKKTGFIRALTNSVIVVFCSCLFNCIIASMAAYGFAKKKFPGSKAIFRIYLLTLMIPGQVTMIPVFIMMNKAGLTNTYFALIVVILNAFGVFLIRQFFMGIPTELLEAARIDGANEYTILFRIIYPLSIPMLATIAMFVAVGLWNSWFAAQLYMRDENWYPLQLIIRNYIVRNAKPADMQLMEGLRDAAGNRLYLNETGIKMACAVVSTIPMLLIYPFIQKYFESGVTIGAVKG